jgi:deoxyribose-phosphate aldolase
MGHTFTLTPDAARQDLVTFLERAARVNNGSARLVAAGGHLQAYVGILFPRGLLDQTPTVLGLRVFTLEENQEFDVVVPIDALIARAKAALERDEKTLGTPAEVASLAWAAITPPR